MKIDTNFGIQEYLSVVSEIVDGFFDDDGNYIPHIGRLAVMEVFFNHCVKEHDFTLQEPSEDNPYPINAVFTNEGFLKEYEHALALPEDRNDTRINFRNAYWDAMEIVSDKRCNSIRTVNLIASFVEKFFDPDNLAKLFGQSKRLQDIADDENVVSFIGQVLEKQ